MSVDMSASNDLIMQRRNHVHKQALSCCKAFIKRLITRKPMEQVQIEIEINNEMARPLNWIHLTAIGVGSMIGVGIFELSGDAAARYAGPSVIISFILSGIVAFLSALSLSEMASMMSSSGAAYTYTYAAMGEYLAWFIGWNYALMYQLAASTVVVTWSEYVVHFIELVSDYNVTRSIVQGPAAWEHDTLRFFITGQAINLPAIALTIGITILLIVGIRQTVWVNLILVVFKVIILLIFIFACCKYVNRDNYTPFFPSNRGSFSEFGVTGMLQASTYVFFAYVGFDCVATVAQEAKKPTRSLPIATMASIIISLLIYIGICTVMVGLVPYKLLDIENPLSKAIKATPYGLWLLILMDLGAIASLTTVALTLLLSQTRIFYAMAHDGLLPPIFSKLYSRTKAPWVSTIMSGIICAVIAGIGPVDIIGEITSIATIITYLFVHIGVIVMRYTHNDMPRTFSVPFGPWLIPVVGSLLCMLLMASTSKATGFGFLIWTGIGQVVYFSYGFWHSKKRSSIRAQSMNSFTQLVSTVENVAMEHIHNEPELESDHESNNITYF